MTLRFIISSILVLLYIIPSWGKDSLQHIQNAPISNQQIKCDSIAAKPMQLTASPQKDQGKMLEITKKIASESVFNTIPALSNSLLWLIEAAPLDISPNAQKILSNAIDESLLFESKMTVLDLDYLDPIFMPIVFDGKVIPDNFQIYRTPKHQSALLDLPLNNHTEFLQKQKELSNNCKSTINYITYNYPTLVKYRDDDLPEAIKEKQIYANPFTATTQVSAHRPVTETLNIGLPKFTYWVHKFNSSLQFSQTYLTKNWYQGGESNLNIQNNQNYTVTYNNQKNIEFRADVLWKTGINDAPNDSLRPLRFSDDQFRINSKLGLRATAHWYYTFSFLFNTQIFNNYIPNTNTLKSAFLSPAEFNFSLGMDYKFAVPRVKLEGSVILSPLSYNYKFVTSDKVTPKNFGIPEGKSLNQFGSSIQVTSKMKIAYNIYWNGRFFYFTDYNRVQMDFENNFDFILNHMFSTRLFLHWRYDDAIRPRPEKGFLQFKELLSFGFNYRF